MNNSTLELNRQYFESIKPDLMEVYAGFLVSVVLIDKRRNFFVHTTLRSSDSFLMKLPEQVRNTAYTVSLPFKEGTEREECKQRVFAEI